jgi:hypothetical protein
VAASANLRVIAFSIFWRKFNTNGAVVGLAVGLIASIGLILVSPSLMAVDPPNAFRLDFLAQFSAHFSVTNLPPATNSTNFRYAPTRDSAPKKPPATDLGYFTIGRAAYNRRELFGSERYRLAAFSHQRKITFVRTRLVCA